MRGHILEVEFLTLDPKIFDNIQDLFTNSRIYCCNSKLAGLINLRRRNEWFSSFSTNLVFNSLYSYPHSI
jgi:hypothetical protein